MGSRVVVVALPREDERLVVDELLRDMHLIARHVRSGREVLDLVEHEACDYLLMDIHQPDMHGWTMLGKLREIVDLDTISGLMLTNEPVVMPLSNITTVVRPIAIARLRSILDGVFRTLD